MDVNLRLDSFHCSVFVASVGQYFDVYIYLSYCGSGTDIPRCTERIFSYK